jgi:hypothetical protein
MSEFKEGDKIIYTGCSDAQVKWGSNTNSDNLLIKGNSYIVEKVEVHSWHTKLYLMGIKGKFNSVCFSDQAQQGTLQ